MLDTIKDLREGNHLAFEQLFDTGPSVYLIKSQLVTGTSTTNLGRFIGYSAILEIRFDLTKTTKRNI